MRCLLLVTGLVAVPVLLPVGSAGTAADANVLKADEQLLRSVGLGTDSPALVEFFRRRTLSKTDEEKIHALIKLLSDDEFQVREKATQDLVDLGALALPFLQKASRAPDPEVKRRAESALSQIEKRTNPQVTAAAARLLAARKPAGAAEALLGFLPSAEDDTVAEELQRALTATAVRDGKAEPVVVRALTDASPTRRMAAAIALCQPAAIEQRPAVLKLLQDADATVRLKTALALVGVKEKDAVPVLIDLLAQLPSDRAGLAEDVLYELAGDRAPQVPFGSDAAGRKRYREAWAAWWRDNKDKVDLAKLDGVSRGQLVVVVWDKTGATGKVVGMGADGKPRWEIGGLQSPRDAQLLPNDQVLISEYTSKRVTVRNLKGDVLWEKKLAANQLLVHACRLDNGNIFIVCRNALLEVNKDGKEVLNITRPANDNIYAAQKLKDGKIAVINLKGVYTLLDKDGKDLKSFAVGRVTAASGFDVQPDGKVLVPLYQENKVVEYDADGKQTWQVGVQAPYGAARLPNGNVLVCCPTTQKIIEFDRAGKVVRQYELDGRPYRARRR